MSAVLLLVPAPSSAERAHILARVIRKPGGLIHKAYFDGKKRQRALSYWSIGSGGGSGPSALFGGLVASSVGWRWIFWLSIVVAIVMVVVAILAIAVTVPRNDPRTARSLAVSSSAAMPRQTLPLAWPGRMGITCRSQQEELTLRA